MNSKFVICISLSFGIIFGSKRIFISFPLQSKIFGYALINKISPLSKPTAICEKDELTAIINIFWKLSYPSILSPSVSHTNSSVFKFFNNLICFNNNLGYCSSVGFIPFGVGYGLSSFFNKGTAL